MNNKNLKVWLQSNFSFKFALNLTCVPVSDTHCFELDLCTCFRHRLLWTWPVYLFQTQIALNLTCVRVSDTDCFELDLCTCFRHRLLWTWPVYLFQTQIALNLTCVPVSDKDCFELDLCTCFRHRLLWTWPVYVFQTQIALKLTCVPVSDTDYFELDMCTCFRHIFDSPSTYQTLFKYLMDPSNMVHDVFRLSNVCLQQVHLSSVKRTFYCVNEHLNSCVITYFCFVFPLLNSIKFLSILCCCFFLDKPVPWWFMFLFTFLPVEGALIL